MTDSEFVKTGVNKDKAAALHRIWLVVVAVAAVVFVSMGYIYYAGQRMAAVHGPLINAAMEIKLEAATAHLWLEEVISGDRTVTMGDVLKHLDEADWYAQAMLEGGTSVERRFYPLFDSQMREDVAEVRMKLAEFKKVAVERWEAKESAGIGSKIDQRFDSIFKDLIEQVDVVETDLQRVIAVDLKRFGRVQIGLMAGCALLTLAVGMAFRRFVRRQLRDAEKLRTEVTERRRAEEELQSETERLQVLIGGLSATGIGIDVVGIDYEILSQNQLLIDRFGDLTGKRCYQEYMGFDAPCDFCPMKKTIETGRTERVQLTAADERDYEVVSAALPNPDGTVDKVIEVVHDITERKRAEEERQAAYKQLLASEQQLRAANQQLAATNQQLLAREQQLRAEVAERRRAEEVLVKSEDKFRQLFDHMSSGVAVYEAVDSGRDFVFVDFNHAGERMDDIERKDLIGKSILDVFPGMKDFGLLDVFEKVWRTGEPEHYPVSLYEDERIAGWRENYVYKLPSGEIVAVYDDVTKRKKAEEQLRRTRTELEHTSRLVTAGEMASGIAHELNQPLCAILNYANVALRAVKTKGFEQDKLAEILEDIASQTDRAGKIIRRLRSLVKKSEPKQSLVNVNEIIEEVIKLDQAEALEQGIEVLTELADDIQSVMADDIQVQQVVLNLVRNGFEAMTQTPREDRRLTIRTTALDSGRIEVAVCDSGKGLSGDTAERMFDSFYSTRDDGLGVGLSLCRSIIEAHGGKIWAEPNADCGATVRFTLPVKGAKNG